MDDSGRRWIAITAIAVAIVVIALVVLSLTVFPRIFVASLAADQLGELTAKDRLDAQNDVRQVLLRAIAGLVVVTGLVATWANVQIARSRRDLEERGQVTERFTRAVDELGHDNLDVRIGGIYGLERIARDSGEDRVAIAEVLAAFIRGHAPRQPSDPLDDGDPDGEPDNAITELAARVADVHAALTVLGRFPADSDDYRFDLKGTDLRDANLEHANLWAADLRGANLWGANLTQADLTQADLTGASLAHADLGAAGLWGADLTHADLTHADLTHADLTGTNLTHADLTHANLAHANLAHADLRDANLAHANLEDANLESTRSKRATDNDS